MSASKLGGDKSLLTAYLCWLVGGLFGLHHFYLRRDKHAFITLSTFGGYFTLGLIRDLWRLPEYVKDANNDLDYLEKLHQQMKTHKRPPSSIVRQTGIMMMGNLFAYLVEYGIPTELLHEGATTCLKFLLVPFGSALGVWLAGNVGRHQGSIKLPLIAAYAAAIPTIFLKVSHGSFSTLAAMFVFSRYSKEWQVRREKPRHVLYRFAVMFLCVLLYLSLWSSWLYFGCTLEDPETLEPIKCRTAVSNFMKSSAYTNLMEATFMLVETIRVRGFVNIWREIMQEFDISGKSSALATLGLKDDATPSEIIAQHKKLARQYHPDRERDPSKKAEMHEKFIEIQQAYKTLEATVKRFKKEQDHDEL